MAAAFAPNVQRRLSDITRIRPYLPPMDTGSAEASTLEKRRLSSDSSPPYSPSARVLHKEQYTLTTNATNSPPSSSPTTAMVGPSDTAKDVICLCTPKPKIPRPRNGKSLRSFDVARG